VPKKYKEDLQLGNWVDNQRACFKNGKLDPEKKNRLDGIGFEFNRFERAWNLQFKKLQDYYVKHGHCELFWAIDRFIFVLNIATNTQTVSLPDLQAMCQGSIRKTQNWADGSPSSVQSLELA
jgi:hypothetical protein